MNEMETCDNNIDDMYKITLNILNKKQRQTEKMHEILKAGKKLDYLLDNLKKCLTLENLDTLSVIHVSGTKGKGSVCNYCESILRHHGYRTGRYTSPHLISVLERIALNGQPIDKMKFVEYFQIVYNKLHGNDNVANEDVPYFAFLTILAFYIFIKEKVDVAIIEVGIGGENDCTNILRKVKVVGISLIGYDHTKILGDTLEQIAYNKSGIMKPGCVAFTIKQSNNVYNILKNRSIERQCQIKTVPLFNDYEFASFSNTFHKLTDTQKMNISLAIQLSYAWMGIESNQLSLKTIEAIDTCYNPARTEIFNTSYARFFIDGAHNLESIEACIKWFLQFSHSSERILIFNNIGDRNSYHFLELLSKCNFIHAFFVPNKAYETFDVIDQIDNKTPLNNQLELCELNKEFWLNNISHNNNNNVGGKVFSCVSDVLNFIMDNKNTVDIIPDILVTGSLHLAGALLTIINPNLNKPI